MSVVVERDGEQVETSVVPRANPPAGEGPTGVGITDSPISDATCPDRHGRVPASDAEFATR